MAPFPVSQNKALLDAWRKTLGDYVVHSPCTPIEYPKEPLISRTIRALNDHAELHPGKAAVPRYLFVTPPIFIHLAKDKRGRAASLESLQLIVCGASPLCQEISDEFLVHHPNVKYIMQAYGMTEIIISHLPLHLQEGATASSGVVVSGNAQRIVDPTTHKSCKLGESGEILVKGPGLTVGYLNKPETTKLLFDDEGWLHTASQVSPAEIEGILLSSSSIKEVATVGVPQNDGNELVRAYVVKADEELKAEDVEQMVADKLAPSKRITGGVVIVDAMPRSATGKILSN